MTELAQAFLSKTAVFGVGLKTGSGRYGSSGVNAASGRSRMPKSRITRAFFLECPVREIKIGMRVEAGFEDVTDDVTLLQFRPVDK